MKKEKLIKRLHQIQMEILKADEPELNKIGVELLDIEKKIMTYKKPEQKKLLDNLKNI